MTNINSMTNLFSVITYDGVDIYDIWDCYRVVEKYINSTQTYATFAIPKRYRTRWDLVSYVFYDTPSLWWFICLYNNITDPFEINDSTTGEDLTIKIIKPRYLSEILRAIKEAAIKRNKELANA